MKEIKNFNLNFGPQHPAAHGVLRLVLQLNGEKIIKSDAHIGLLHRGTEKLIEQKSVTQALPYLDRLDYVSMFCNEHVFSQAIEKNAFLNIGFKNQNTRVILLELTRILNHLMCITTHVMDVGALTPFLWGFEEREKIMEIYERLSGARMHAAYIRPGGEITQFPKDVLANIINFYKDFFSRIEEIAVLLSKNRVLIKRLSNVGVINEKTATMYSLTGPLIRSIGLPVDVRITNPYECYKILNFKTIIARHGDTYARYFLRIEEMKESLKIIKACIENITALKEDHGEKQEMNPNKIFVLKQNMEEIIQHFEKNAKGFSLTADESFCCVESPKGILGVFLGTNKSRRIYRCKFRTPGFFHLQAFDAVSKTHSLSDAVAIIGTKDIVFGEVDR